MSKTMDVKTFADKLTSFAEGAKNAPRTSVFIARRAGWRKEFEDVEDALEVRVGWRRAGSRRIYKTMRAALDREQCPVGDLRAVLVIVAGRKQGKKS